MKTLVIGLLMAVLLSGGVLLGRYYYVQRRLRKQAKQKYELIRPLISKLSAGEVPSHDEIATLVQWPSLRPLVFDMLRIHDRSSLFPAEYRTFEKSAESTMVMWLEFPTELGRAPESIELMACVTLWPDKTLNYYVFRYLAKPTRWSTHNVWMMGVCGPYNETSKLYDPPPRVFSRFNTTDSITAEEEARWIHENIRPYIAAS